VKHPVHAWASEGGAGEGLSPPDFEIPSKKGCFLSFEWEKSNFTTFDPLEKCRKKSPSAPLLEKVLPMPMYAWLPDFK